MTDIPEELMCRRGPHAFADYEAHAKEGMARAESHANSLEPDWSSTAYLLLASFCEARKGCHFTSEDVRRWCELRGFDSPVPKAWGSVMQKGARNKLIRKIGLGVAKQRHGSPCPLWTTA